MGGQMVDICNSLVWKKIGLIFQFDCIIPKKKIKIPRAPYLDLVTNLTPKLRRNTTFLIKQTWIFIILVHTCHTSIPWNTIADNFLFDKKSNRISIDTYLHASNIQFTAQKCETQIFWTEKYEPKMSHTHSMYQARTSI